MRRALYCVRRLAVGIVVAWPSLVQAEASARVSQSAAVIAEGWHHKVWLVYPPEKVKADDGLPDTPKLERIQIFAAQGEYEPFILLIRSGVPLRGVRVEFEDLKGPGGAVLAAANFGFRRVAYVYVDEPSGTRIKEAMPFETGTGLYPDPLPTGEGVARPDRNLQLWVTTYVPRGTKPGVYEGVVWVRFRKEGWMPEGKVETAIRLPISLRVRNFALPEPSPLLNTAFFSPNWLSRERRDASWLRAFYRDFVSHHQIPEPVLPSPVLRQNKDGTMSVDTTEWEKTAAFFFEELRASHLFLPVWGMHPEPTMMQGIYFIWHFPAAAKQRWFGPFICDDRRELTPEFRRLFGSYVSQMAGMLKRRGWLDRVYIATMDEPYTYHTSDRQLDVPANNYELVRNFVKLVREQAPGLKTFVTGDPVPELEGYIDHWCLRNLKHAAKARERAARSNEVFTFCDNYRTLVDFPMVSARTLGWLAWKLGAQGWLTYETMGGFPTAWEGPVTVYPMFSGATVWGLGQMLYPEPTTAGVVPSIRWEMMREGCEDYEYLWLLRQRLAGLSQEQAQRLGGAARDAAAAAHKLLETCADEVVGGSGDPETSSVAGRPNTQSNLVTHKLRSRVADLIEELHR